jgi:hypothetical protein
MSDNDRATTTVDRAILEEALKSLQELIRDVDPDAGRPPGAAQRPAHTAGTPAESAPPALAPQAGAPPGPVPTAAEPDRATELENEDLPVLTEAIESTEAGQATTFAAEPEVMLLSARAQLDAGLIPDITDSAIRLIDGRLRETTGRTMDPATRLRLRRQIYVALQEWTTSAAGPEPHAGETK